MNDGVKLDIRYISSPCKGSVILSSFDMLPSDLDELLTAASYARKAHSSSSFGMLNSTRRKLPTHSSISGEVANDVVFQSSTLPASPSWIVAGSSSSVDNANRHFSNLSEKASALSAIAQDLEASFEGAKQMLDAAESRALLEKDKSRRDNFLRRLDAIIAEADE